MLRSASILAVASTAVATVALARLFSLGPRQGTPGGQLRLNFACHETAMLGQLARHGAFLRPSSTDLGQGCRQVARSDSPPLQPNCSQKLNIMIWAVPCLF
jgi:hypothetical protein